MDKETLHIRLKKAAGQVMAVDRMLEEGRDTASLLVQLNAANSALRADEGRGDDPRGIGEGKAGEARCYG